VNLLQLDPDEQVEAVIDAREFADDRFLMFITRNGVVKKTALAEYDKTRTDGLIAINLREGDELVRVFDTSGDDDVFIVSRNGSTIRFSENDVRAMGRSAGGVRGMRLRDGDVVVAADAAEAEDERELLVVTNGGYGKRTELAAFPRKGRGSMGVRGIRLKDGRGDGVVGARMVSAGDELILVSSGGTLIRTAVDEIAVQGRDASGVRVMNVDDDEQVAALAPVPATDELPEDADTRSAGDTADAVVGDGSDTQ
jgi:DNA gyrase subunit A